MSVPAPYTGTIHAWTPTRLIGSPLRSTMRPLMAPAGIIAI